MQEFAPYGVWVPIRAWPSDPRQIAEAAAEIESLGYGSVWLGGSPPDDLALAEAILAATSRLVVGTSIIDVWRSDPAVLAASDARVRSAFPGRFYLGVGSGHAPAVEATGQKYVRPLSKLRDFLAAIPSVPADERMIAALGPKALETARELTAGALPYLVPPAHTADARAILGPDKLLIPEQKVFLGTDETVARRVARRGTAQYLHLPNYLNNLRRYGLTDEDFAGEGSDRWVDTLVVRGDEKAVKAGVDAHFAAGADHVAVQVLAESAEPALPRAEWRAVARALFGA
jgi:probable F420-dependent oxidoreductase